MVDVMCISYLLTSQTYDKKKNKIKIYIYKKKRNVYTNKNEREKNNSMKCTRRTRVYKEIGKGILQKRIR